MLLPNPQSAFLPKERKGKEIGAEKRDSQVIEAAICTRLTQQTGFTVYCIRLNIVRLCSFKANVEPQKSYLARSFRFDLVSLEESFPRETRKTKTKILSKLSKNGFKLRLTNVPLKGR